MNFPSFSDLLISILSPESQLFPPSDGISQSILTNINFTFPLYSGAELKIIAKEMQKSKWKITPIAHKYFPVPFIPGILNNLINDETFFLKNYTFVSYFVLTSYIAWEIQFNKESKEEDIIILLNALIKISIPSKAPIDQNIYKMGATAIYYVFKRILEENFVSDFLLYFKPLETYFSFFPDLPQVVFSIFSMIMERFILDNVEEIPKKLQPIFSLISVSIVTYPEYISSDTVDAIITPILYSISKLDIESLGLLSHLAPRLSQTLLMKCFTLFPNSIVLYINKIEIDKPTPIPYNERPELPIMNTKEVNYRIPDKKTFPNGINFKDSNLFPERVPFECFLGADMMARLALIKKAAAPNKDVINIFMDSLEILMMRGKDDSFFFGLEATYLYLASNLYKYMNKENTIRILLSTPFFHPCITVFDKLDSFPVIDSMRSTIIEIIVREGPSMISIAINFWKSQPALFSEIIQRIGRCLNVSNLKYDKKMINTLSIALMDVSLYYQKADLQFDNEFIETARSSIFLFISHLLEDKQIANLMFNCTYFISSFLPFVFEEPLRPFVLSNLLQFLSNNEISETLLHTLMQIFGICYSYSENIQYMNLFSVLLQTLIDTISHNSSNAKLCTDLIAPMLEALTRISGECMTKGLLLDIITFITLVPIKLTSPQIATLQVAISKVFINEFPQSLNTKLLMLMSHEQLASFAPNFYIGQPKAVKLYLNVSMFDQENTLKAIKYLDDLISSSASNAFAVHEAGFDMHILNLLKDDSKCTKEVTEALLDLFLKIALEASSVSVVHRFISLLSPISGRFIPKYQEQYLKTLINMLSASIRYPNSYLQIRDRDDYIEINGLTGEMLEKGCISCMWVYIDTGNPHYKPPLITFTDSKGKKLKWFISGDELFVTQRTTEFESTGHFEVKLQSHKWIFITMQYKICNNVAEFRITQNLKVAKHLEFYPVYFEKGPVKCVVGNDSSDIVDSEQNVRIGSFGVWSDLDRESTSAIYQNGVSCDGPIPQNNIFLYSINSSEDETCVIQKNAEGNFTVQVPPGCSKVHQSFVRCLLRYCKVDMLLPLFAQFDMTFVNGERMESLTKLAIETVGNALFVNENINDNVGHFHGFKIIAHLLSNLSKEHLNYILYTQFYSMLQSTVNTKTQQDIIKDILLNVSIWIKSDPDNHLKIIRHWTRVLIPSYGKIVADILPVKSLLSIMRLYYWYEGKEKPQILGEDRFRGLPCDIQQMRQVLINALIEIASVSFDESDFKCIQSHCITCIESKQTIDILVFLEDLCIKYPHILASLKTDLTSFLYGLLNRQEPEILEHCISLLIAFHNAKIDETTSLTSQAFLIIQKLSSKIVNEKIFSYVISRMKEGFYELMPLACWMSIYMDNKVEACRRIFIEIDPFPDTCYHVTWSIWPIILSFRHDKETAKIILDFVSRSAASKWNIVFCLINVVGFILGIDASDIIAIFLMNIAQNLTSEGKVSKSEIDYFFKISKFFIFYRVEGWKNPAIIEIYKDIVPEEEDSDENISKESLIDEFISQPCSFADRLNKIRTIPIRYNFSIRLTKEGKWVDDLFAMFIISLFSRFDSRDFLDCDFLICSFLLHSHPDIVKEHFTTLKLSPEEMQKYNMFISLLNHHAKMCGLEDVIPNKMSTEENSYLCLQRQQFLMDISTIDMQKIVFEKVCIYFNDFNEIMLSSFSFTTDFLVFQSLKQVSSAICDEKSKIRQNKHLWSLLWRNLAGDLAPWTFTDADNVFYKRDNTLCAFFCPFKLKRDWNHSSHIDASEARDACLIQTQNDKEEEDKNQKEEQDPIELLVIENVHQKDKSKKKSFALNSLQCKIISPGKEKDARFVLTKNSVRIEYVDGKETSIPSADIQYVFFRRRFHRPNAIEIITIYGKSYFIHFVKHLSLPIIAKISSLHLPNISILQTRDFFNFFKVNNKTDAWVNNTISTFEYLMHLNVMSGRSFNDLSQYPVFPWILADYKSSTIDSDSPTTWRDLSKSIGSLGEERLNDILRRMPDLALIGERPYMFGSGYSCALTVCLFLIRTEPFTTLHIELQSGRFDHASRIFSSIGNAWNMVCNHLSDYRELIPEFFFSPEFLENRNKFDLGKTKNGSISEVELPNWAANAHDFIYLHRKALESQHVSQNINNWIDLIWGVTSRGELAKKHYNMFRAEMYDDAWDEEALKNPRRRVEIEATLCHVGQIAPQLFYLPHPQRNEPVQGKLFTKAFSIASKEPIDVVLARIDRGEDIEHFMVSICNNAGKYLSCILDFSEGESDGQRDAIVYSKEIKGFAELGITTQLKQSMICDIPKGKFLVISPKSKRVFIVNFKNACVDPCTSISNECTCLSSNNQYDTYATTGSVLQIFRLNQLVTSVSSYRESINCCYTSGTFYISVFGTKDGYLFFAHIPSGEIVKVVNLGEYRPQLVLITQQWGFVLVYATKIVDGIIQHYLLLYSINGDLLRETKIEFGVAAWYTYASFDGFDYVCLGDEKGRIFIFEAFFLSLGEAAHRCKSAVVAIRYFRKIDTAIAVDTNGIIYFIPFVPKECIKF